MHGCALKVPRVVGVCGQQQQQQQKPCLPLCPQMYFNSTLTDSSKLLKPLLVFSFVICAIICGLTRIIQYKNHAVDVYLGFLLGGAIAVYLVGHAPRPPPPEGSQKT